MHEKKASKCRLLGVFWPRAVNAPPPPPEPFFNDPPAPLLAVQTRPPARIFRHKHGERERESPGPPPPLCNSAHTCGASPPPPPPVQRSAVTFKTGLLPSLFPRTNSRFLSGPPSSLSLPAAGGGESGGGGEQARDKRTDGGSFFAPGVSDWH